MVSHVQHSVYCTVFTDLMYYTVYTVQYVQISCTTQHTLCSMYRSHVQLYGSEVANLNRMAFSTPDGDNDLYRGVNCAHTYKGGWWYNAYAASQLNGIYQDDIRLRGKETVAWHETQS